MKITEFIMARLDEDERLARQANDAVPGARPTYPAGDDLLTSAVALALFNGTHRPSRVFRDVQAKRKIIERYADCLARMEDDDYSLSTARDQAREYEDFILPSLAAIWSDHPDYYDTARMTK